jgi:hypothetical protein
LIGLNDGLAIFSIRKLLKSVFGKINKDDFFDVFNFQLTLYCCRLLASSDIFYFLLSVVLANFKLKNPMT